MQKNKLINIDSNNPRALAIFCLVAPVFFGLISLWLGPDSNWDLRNYHLYNAYSLLNGKWHLDLAPAGMQTYFNPIADVPYYLMSAYLKAPIVGFIMGALYGANCILLAGICRKALPDLPVDDRFRMPLLLTIFGCLTANFLSGIGNTMGDGTTSLFVLASLLLVLHGWSKLSERGIRGLSTVIIAGLFAGLGAGLKLTNVVYALALCVGFFVVPVSWAMRLRLAFSFGIGVLIGMGVTGGYWFYEMWHSFGNPLFPQFSALFPNPLTRAISVSDVKWLPKNNLETMFWPFIFSLNAKRVGQLALHQFIWPVVYIIFWYWFVVALIRTKVQDPSSGMSPPSKYIFAFVAIGYVIWMKSFSIQRYLVPIEVCAPLLVFILLTQLTHYQNARKITLRILVITTAIVLLGGVRTWGHASFWSEKMFSIDLPLLATPEKTVVVLAGGDPPFGWVAAEFPPGVAFVQVQGNFPESTPEFGRRIHDLVRKRGGPVFAIVQAENPSRRINQIAKVREVASSLGITTGEAGCVALRWAAVNLSLRISVTGLDQPLGHAKCSIDMLASERVDVYARNKEYVLAAGKKMAMYGYSVDSDSCKPHVAYIGKEGFPFQWCKLLALQ